MNRLQTLDKRRGLYRAVLSDQTRDGRATPWTLSSCAHPNEQFSINVNWKAPLLLWHLTRYGPERRNLTTVNARLGERLRRGRRAAKFRAIMMPRWSVALNLLPKPSCTSSVVSYMHLIVRDDVAQGSGLAILLAGFWESFRHSREHWSLCISRTDHLMPPACPKRHSSSKSKYMNRRRPAW